MVVTLQPFLKHFITIPKKCVCALTLKKRPSAQDRPLKICFTKRFAAIEDKAKPRFMIDLASLNAEHLRQICFLLEI